MKRSNGKVESFLDFRLIIVKALLKIDIPTHRQTNVPNMPTTSTTRSRMKLMSGDEVHLPEELPKNDKGRTKIYSYRV